MKSRLRRVSFVTFLITVLALTGSIQSYGKSGDYSCFSAGWPSERSEFNPDPAMLRGTLANGMRYVVMENDEPENRVALYLYINVGALMERDEQKGMAHYLEHMLFNGSTHFKPGELVKFFQEIGMNFGGDTNAHTGYDETVYEIILPDGKEENLKKGLLVMSDYARGALLLKSEVDRERGVILAEKRARDSVGYRINLAKNEFKFRGTLLADRPIIGTSEVLKRIDADDLKAFYNGWYRPDNMMLVVVGDVQPSTVLPVLKDMFAPLESAGKQPECPDFGMLQHSGLEVFYYPEKELGSTEVIIEKVKNIEPMDDSTSRRKEELHRLSSTLIMRDRINRILEQEQSPFNNAGYYSGELMQRVHIASLSAQTDAKNWRGTLKKLESTLRQAVEYGFTKQELVKVKKDIKTMLETAVQTVDGRNSEQLSRQIIRHFSENMVFMSPEQEFDLYMPLLERMELADVNAILSKDWSGTDRLISVIGNAEIRTQEPKKEIFSVYQESAAQGVAALHTESVPIFPYLKVADKDIIPKKREYLESIDTTRIELANNIIVSLKKTDFEPNVVHLIVDVGQGKMSETVPGMGMVTEAVVNESGTGKLTRTEVSDVLSGSSVNLDFSITRQSFRWKGKALKGDTELLIQLAYTVLVDPGFRRQSYNQVQSRIAQMYNKVEKDIHSVMNTQVNRFLAGGDNRIGLPKRETVASLQFAQLQQWLLDQLDKECIEITVVGDFSEESVIGLLLRYFGSLEQREPVAGVSSTLDFPEGELFQTSIASSVNRSMVVVAWPTAAVWDIQRTRRLNVLAEVLRERLRMVVREKLGASYSPKVYNFPSRVFVNYGKLVVQILVAPGNEQAIIDEILKIAEDLRSKGIAESELKRTLGPIITSLKDSVQKNSYWLYSVLVNSGKYSDKLEWPKTMIMDYTSISIDEISRYAAEFLQNTRRATAIVTTEITEEK